MGGSSANDDRAVPRLAVATATGGTVVLEPDRDYIVGRDPGCTVVLDDRRVSRRHAVLRVAAEGWELVDTGSVNGSYLRGRRVGRIVVGAGCEVLLGDPDDGASLRLAPAAQEEPPPAGSTTEPGPGPAPGPAAGPGREPERGGGPEPEPAAGPEPESPTPDEGAPAHRPDAGTATPDGPPRPATPRGGPAAGAPPSWANIEPGPWADPRPSVDRRPSVVMRVPVRPLRIGRALDNDLVLTDLMVSRHHAELRSSAGGGHEIVDLGSHNGVYVNGRRTEQAVVGPQDIVGIGHATFRLDGQVLREFVDTGEVTLDVQDLEVRVGDRTLLHDVSFPVGERTLLAVVGTSGAGKSTLLKALTGAMPVHAGSVLYDGRDMFDQFAELRQRIGLVPQDDILHRQLTVRQALRYAARLRFPQDTDSAERDRRVEEVIADLSLTERADLRIDRLSGGQRKRVSVAVELLTKPSLLYLDEPTSGLDIGSASDLMDSLRTLADDGRTVVTVLHDLESAEVCDRLLILVTGGGVAYYGPPAEALAYFGKDSWKNAFRMINNATDHDLAAEFRASEHYTRYVAAQQSHLGEGGGPGESGHAGAPAREAAPAAKAAAKPPKQQSWGSQLLTLSRRYFAVIRSDRRYLALLLAAPLLLGLLSRAIPGALTAATGVKNPDAVTKLLVLFVITGLMGTATSANELIKERAIYQRERSAGLLVSAYLCSKLLVLGVISAIQGAVLTLVALAGQKLPPNGVVFGSSLVELGVAVVLSAVASMALGLVISAVVGTPELVMPLLVVVAIVQVVLCGGLFALNGTAGIEQVAWLAPARWAFAAAASTVDLIAQKPYNPGETPDPMWRHDAGTWSTNVAVLAGLILGYALAAMVLLRRLDPSTRRRRRARA